MLRAYSIIWSAILAASLAAASLATATEPLRHAGKGRKIVTPPLEVVVTPVPAPAEVRLFPIKVKPTPKPSVRTPRRTSPIHEESLSITRRRRAPRAVVVEPANRWGPLLSVKIWTDREVYAPGDEIQVYFRASRDCYLYIFNVDTRGVERQIYPNRYDTGNRVPGGRTMVIPDNSYRLMVNGPPGRETLRAVAVTKRSGIIRPYERFDSGEPYPIRPGGSERLLNALKSEAAKESKASKESKAPKESRSHKGNRGRGYISPHVSVEPPPSRGYPGYRYAEAHTSFRVRDSYYPWPSIHDGHVRIKSTPSGADVYIDDVYKGETPIRITGLAYGSHDLRIVKRGYREHWQRIQIRWRKTERLDIRLKRARY